MKHVAFTRIFLLTTLLPSIIYAWGGDGHQLICLIAEDRLTPSAKAAIHDLLHVQKELPERPSEASYKLRVQNIVDGLSPRLQEA